MKKLHLKYYVGFLFTIGISLLIMASEVGPNLVKDGYQLGDTVKDFKLKNVDGQYVSLSDGVGNKGYILVFTCNTCPWARGYEQRIIQLNEKYAPKGYPVVAIQPNDTKVSPGDSYEEMSVRAKEKGYTFPYLLDETQEVTLAYGATKTPEIYVLERENKDFVIRYIGGIDDSPRDAASADKKFVEMAVDNLLAGKQVEVTTYKAIGCTIKLSEKSKTRVGKSE